MERKEEISVNQCLQWSSLRNFKKLEKQETLGTCTTQVWRKLNKNVSTCNHANKIFKKSKVNNLNIITTRG